MSAGGSPRGGLGGGHGRRGQFGGTGGPEKPVLTYANMMNAVEAGTSPPPSGPRGSTIWASPGSRRRRLSRAAQSDIS